MFHAGQMSMTLLGVKTATDLDFNTPEAWQWLSEHWQEDSVSFYRQQKPYDKQRTQVLFALIEQGGVLSSGDLAQRLEALIP